MISFSVHGYGQLAMFVPLLY